MTAAEMTAAGQNPLMRLSLERARWYVREGLATRAQWDEYVHAWQTSAPRIAVRACQCAACVDQYPDAEYQRVSP